MSYFQRCREALAVAVAGLPTALISAERPSPSVESSEHQPVTCQHCGSESLRLIREIGKPSWKALLHRDSERCPQWYRASQRADDREFWDGVMGEGFSDFYESHLKTQAESAKGPPASSAPPSRQLWLAGMKPTGSYQALSL